MRPLDPSLLRQYLRNAKAPSSKWINNLEPYQLFLRASVPRYVNNTLYERPVDLANVYRKGNRARMDYVPPEKRPPRGRFRELVEILEDEAIEAGYDSVYVENIMNEFLPDLFASMGYIKDTGSPWSSLPSMIKPLRRP